LKIVLIGADGQLGTDLLKILQKKHNKVIVPLYFPDFDITKPYEAETILTNIKPEIIINTAAYNLVDEAEVKPISPFRINAIAVRDLALVCRNIGSTLIHFSTDYVFNGEKKSPYIEEDTPKPISVYGISKLAGELFIQGILKKYFIIRTCGLYGIAGCWGKGTNFVDTMISKERKGDELKVVNDQWITPTSTWELAGKVGELCEKDFYGIYHLTNEGYCTWFEFAVAIFSLLKINPKINPKILPIASESFNSKARRPAFSVLENKKAKKNGITGFSNWKEALRGYLIRKGHMTGGES